MYKNNYSQLRAWLQLVLFAVITVFWLINGYENAFASTQDVKQQGARKFVVASSDNFPPVNMLDKDGNLTGFGRDLSTAVIRTIGGQTDYIHSSSWTEVLDYLNSGKADFIHDTAYAKERDIFLDFSDPILEMKEVIIVRSEQYNITGFESLKGKTVACVNKHITHLYLMQFPEIICHIVKTPAEGLYSLIAGDVDAFVYPEQIVAYLSQELRFGDKIKVTGEPLRTLKWSMAVRAGDKELLRLLNEGIRKVRESGEYERIYTKWFGKKILAGYSQKEIRFFGLITVLLSLAFGIAIGLFILNIRLRSSRNELSKTITERTKAEQALDASRKLLHDITDNSSSLIYALDLEDRFLLINRRLESLFGVPLETLIGKTRETIMPPEIASMHRTHDLQVIAKQQPITFEENNIEPDGNHAYLSVKFPLLDSQGNLYGIGGMSTDITARKLMEEELRLTKERFETIFKEAPLGIALIDSHAGHIYAVNPMFAKIAGRTLEEMTTIEWMSTTHPDDVQEELDNMALLNAGKIPGFNMRKRYIRPDGTVVWINMTIAPVTVEDKSHPSHLCMIQDITESLKAERALLASEMRYRGLLEDIQLLAVMLDSNGSIIFCNDYLLALAGWSREEVLNRNWFEIFLPEGLRESVYAMFKTGISDGTIPSHHESLFVTRDGMLRTIVWNNSILRDPDRNISGVACLGIDVTDHRKLEEQLLHAQKMEAVGTLAGGIAHDFNNILNVIMGYGSMIMDKLEAGSTLSEQMTEVLAAAERAAALTKRLLVFSRKQVVEVKPVNVNEIIVGIQKMLARMVRENIEIKLNLAGSPLIVLADTGQIEQVLMNLATNAKDAMLEGGRLTISTGLAEFDDEYVAAYGYGKTGKYALITVADTGCGMDAETREKIFEPFFTTKGIGEGTGLGLAITYGIIKQHNGYIKVYSEPEKGTEFKIYLPLVEEMAESDIKTEELVSARGGSETILVAEDDEAMRRLTQSVLEAFGYTVITAEDGEIAIKKFKENRDKLHLVILDMIMPKKNGKEAYEEIKKMSPGIKSLFMSGYTMDIIKTDELTEAGLDFVHKPIRPQDLLIKVREMLDRE